MMGGSLPPLCDDLLSGRQTLIQGMEKHLHANANGCMERWKIQFNCMIGHIVFDIVGVFPQIDTKNSLKKGDFTPTGLLSPKGINLGSNVQRQCVGCSRC